MNSIFEHVVNKIWVWLDEVIECTQNLEILSLFLMEQIKSNLILIKLHFGNSLLEFTSLIFNHLLSFLDFLLLFLKLFNFLINLFLHHLKQVLMLNFELVHDSSE